MSTPESRFLATLTKKASAPFDDVEFFRGSSFVRALDLRPSKLADALGTPLTTPGVKPPKLDVPDAPSSPVDMLQQGSRPKKAPNNPSGFHGSAAPGDAGDGFNPTK